MINTYTPTADDYTRVLSTCLPFSFKVWKTVTTHSMYLDIHSPVGSTHFYYDRDFYSLIAYIISYYQTNHPELFI